MPHPSKCYMDLLKEEKKKGRKKVTEDEKDKLVLNHF
jgi:hypothetical protein